MSEKNISRIEGTGKKAIPQISLENYQVITRDMFRMISGKPSTTPERKKPQENRKKKE